MLWDVLALPLGLFQETNGRVAFDVLVLILPSSFLGVGSGNIHKAADRGMT